MKTKQRINVKNAQINYVQYAMNQKINVSYVNLDILN